MKKLINAALTAALVAGLFGAASADNHMDKVPNHKQAGGTWYYPYIGPSHDDYGTPMMGFRYDEDYMGEVVYMDDYISESSVVFHKHSSYMHRRYELLLYGDKNLTSTNCRLVTDGT